MLFPCHCERSRLYGDRGNLASQIRDCGVCSEQSEESLGLPWLRLALFIRFVWVHEMREIVKMRIGAHGDSVICLGLTLGRLVN